MELESRTFQGKPLEYACGIARLELSAERRTVVGATLEGIYALIDSLDGIELGDTPPASAFDPRWE